MKQWLKRHVYLVSISCLIVFGAFFSGCQRTNEVLHATTTPNIPSGPTSAEVGQEVTFSTGGASCTRGHAVQYRFDWGDGTFSSWSSLSSANKAWSTPGTYQVRAQARCATEPAVVSGWSSAITIVVTQAGPSGSKLQILEWQLLPYDNMFMPWVIRGRAKNISGRVLGYAEVRGQFCDATGVLLCSWLDNITDLPAGVVGEFNIYYMCGENAERVHHATVREGTCS